MYSFNSRVRFSECDEAGLLSVPAAIDYLQDCSTFHSEAIDRGPAHIRETGLAWLLAAWEVEFFRRPRFGEEISVYTWATSFKGLRASRNFLICEASDTEREHPLVRADSSWFMYDANTQRPIRIPESESAAYADNTPALDMPPIARILRVEGEGTAVSPIVVTGAHLDTNHHVNNAQYVSLALGALEELDHEMAAKAASIDKPYIMDVYYATAAKLGDTICPHVHKVEETSAPAANATSDSPAAPDSLATAIYITLDNEEGKPYATVRLREN